MPYQKTKEGRLVNEITLGDGYPLSNDLQPLKIGGEASVIEISHPLPDGSDNGLFKVNGDLDITGTLKTKLSHDLIYDFDDEVNTLAQAKVDALIDSATAALDTLNELAAALGDDANFATTVTNSLALKAPLAAPAFTGDATFDSTTLTIDSSNNRVGIGTASPSRELHIYRNNIYAAVEIQGSSKSLYMGGNWGIGYTTSTDLEFKINNSTQMIIDSGARVGIGTTSPSVKLDVEESSVSALIDIHQSASGTGTDSGIRFQKNSNLKGTVGYNAGTDTVNLNYGAFDNTHLNIDSSGNVGIGTASPAVNLHVKDDSGSNTLETIRVENSNGYAELGAQSTYVRLLAGGSLTYAANSSASYFYIGGLGKMGLTSTGLGIGNTSPSEALDVSGNANVSGTIASGSHITASGNQDTTVTAQATGTAGAATRTGTFALLNDNAAWNLQIAGGTSASAGFFEIRDNITQLLKIDRQDYGGDVHVIKDLSVEGDNGIIAGAVVWERFPFIVSSGVAGRYYYRDVDDGVNSFALWDDYDTDPTGFSYLDVPGQYVVPEDCTLKAMSAVVTNFTSTTSVTLSIYHGTPNLDTTSDTTLALAGTATTVTITTARRAYSASATYDVDLTAGDIIVPTVSHANSGATQTMRGNITLKFVTREKKYLV